MTNLSQDNKPDALTAYNKLKLIDPTMARGLRHWHLQQSPFSTITLPN